MITIMRSIRKLLRQGSTRKNSRVAIGRMFGSNKLDSAFVRDERPRQTRDKSYL
jgi:hypothetical protein